MWLVLMLLPVFAVVPVVALARRPEVRVSPQVADDLRAVRRRRTAARVLGPLVGVGVALLVLDRGPGLGLAVPLAAAAVLLGLLAVVCVAELAARPVRTRVRTATLQARRPVDLVPRAAARLAVSGVGMLGVLLVVGWAMGDPDDQGRAGRSLATHYRDDLGVARGSAHGPWPGSFYAVPMLIVLALAVALTAVTLLVVARRAQPSARSAEADLVLRRGVAEVVAHALAATGWLLAVPFAQLMAMALLGVDGGPGWYAALGVLCLVVAPVGAVLGIWSLSRALVEPRVRVDGARRGEPVVT